MPTIVIGHRNPDTDAICSAIGYAELLRQTTRTADVHAGTDGVEVYWMDSDTFLAAMDGTPRSLARAQAEATRRLQS